MCDMIHLLRDIGHILIILQISQNMLVFGQYFNPMIPIMMVNSTVSLWPDLNQPVVSKKQFPALNIQLNFVDSNSIEHPGSLEPYVGSRIFAFFILYISNSYIS